MYVSPYAIETYADGADGDVGNGPLYVFETPWVYDIPNYLPTSRMMPETMLWRHFRQKPRGVNVFVLSDNSVVQDTATVENSNSNIPLPFILNDPSGPYSYTTNWDGTIETATLPVYIQYVYEGGHLHTINQFEAEFLSAAGYSTWITAL